VWAATWLYRATNDTKYLNTAESLYNESGLQNWNGAFNWDNKISGIEVSYINHLNAELNPSCQLLALLGAHHIFHISRVRVKKSMFTMSLTIQ
jgi:hypothetical protein